MLDPIHKPIRCGSYRKVFDPLIIPSRSVQARWSDDIAPFAAYQQPVDLLGTAEIACKIDMEPAAGQRCQGLGQAAVRPGDRGKLLSLLGAVKVKDDEP